MDLEDFYYNGIFPMGLEGHTPNSEEYRQSNKMITDLENQLLNIIDNDIAQIYRELKNCFTKASGIEAACAFKVGYRLGGQMILAVVNDKE